MLKILFLIDKDSWYFRGGKVQSANAYLTWYFYEVTINQITICKLLPFEEIKQYQEKWLQHVQRMDTDYQNKHYIINQKDEET